MAMALLRNWWVVGLVVATFLLLGILFLVFAPRSYEATARIEVSQPSGTPLGAASSVSSATTDSRDTDRAIQTEVDLLQTRETARLVLAKLQQDKKQRSKVAEFRPETLQEQLNVVFPRNSRIIPVTVEDADPARAAAIANAYAEVLIERNFANHRQAVTYSRDYLANQLEKARLELEKSRRAPIQYAQQQGIVDASEGSSTGQGTRSLTTTSLLQLNSSYAQAKVDRIRAQQRWQQAQATPLLALPEVIANSAVQTLLQQKAIQQAKLSQDRQRYGLDYPGVVQQTANINALNEQIARLAENVRNSLRDQYSTALQQEQALAGNVNAAKVNTLADQARGVNYGVLQREADTSQAVYDALLQRYKEVNAEIGVATNNITLVDRATAPAYPASPEAGKTLAVAIALGLIAGIIAAFVRSQLDDRVRDSNRLAHDLRFPLLAAFDRSTSVRHAGSQRDEQTVTQEVSAAILIGKLELAFRGSLPKTVCLAGCATVAGQSAIAVALASTLAVSGRNVLLVTSDATSGPGLLDLGSGVAAASAIESSAAFRGDQLSIGGGHAQGASATSIGDLDRVLSEVSARYDMIVVSTPPMLGDANSLRIAAIAEVSILVYEESESSVAEVRACAELLRPVSRMIGAVAIIKREGRFVAHVSNRVRADGLPLVAA